LKYAITLKKKRKKKNEIHYSLGEPCTYAFSYLYALKYRHLSKTKQKKILIVDKIKQQKINEKENTKIG
jgi:hypothetical protein